MADAADHLISNEKSFLAHDSDSPPPQVNVAGQSTGASYVSPNLSGAGLSLPGTAPPYVTEQRVLATEPLFLGCCLPAITCCCGCSLQWALKALSVLALVLGILDMLAGVVSSSWALFAYFCLRGCSLTAFGIFGWTDASTLKAERTVYLYVMAALVCCMNLGTSIGQSIYLASPEFRSSVISAYREAMERKSQEPLTPEQEEELKRAVALLTATFQGFVWLNAFFVIAATLGVAYLVWSYATRLKRGEGFIVATGLTQLPAPTLPTVAAGDIRQFQRVDIPGAAPATYTVPIGPSISNAAGMNV